MPSFQIVHIREQGQDIIIVPLDYSFERKREEEQRDAVEEFQLHATAAGLAGTVTIVWDAGGGRTKFIAPHPWHPFFRSLSLAHVARLINRTLSW
jgi:hypothetical protein